MVIYKITNIINNKSYIGQTIKDINSRFTSHKSRARSKITHRSALHKAIKKYGEENFIIEEIDGANNITDLNYKEWLLIYKHNTMYPNGYNLKEGGNNATHSKKTKEKQSKVMKIKYNKKALDNARQLSIKKISRPVIFENSKTGEKIEFNKIKDTSIMGNHKYINDLLTGKRPYGLYKGYWIYYKSDKNYMKKRKYTKKMELNIKIKAKGILTRDIRYFKSKKEATELLNISKYILNKYLDSGIPYKNYIFERDL